MSKLFNHTVQPLGSTTSPVEDLALEVEDAFTGIEGIVDVSNTVIGNFGNTIGNPVFESLEGHGVDKTATEVHNMLPNESNIILRNIPNDRSLTLSYIDHTGATTTLTEVAYDQDFTDKNQFKRSGKYVILNIRVPNNGSVSISATYTTKTFSLGGKKFLSNVVSKEDGTFEILPETVGTNSYALVYDTKIKDNPEKHFDKPLSFFMKDGNEYKKLKVTSYRAENERIVFDTTELDPNKKVLAFAENTDLSTLVNALYKEFRGHTHSKADMTGNIDASDLSNRFINTDKINYKDDNVNNYLFPQYFNREGYNPDLDSVYENSILGDVFISRVISDTVQEYKGLDADSNALVFGDPVKGHKIKYSRQDEALTLSSVVEMNGLRILTEEQRYALGLNNTKLKSGAEGFKIEPEANKLSVKSTDGVYTSEFDKIVSDKAELKDVTSPKVTIGKANLTAHTDGAEVTGKVVFKSPVEAEKITVNDLVSTREVTFASINSPWAKFGNIHFKVVDGNLVVSDEGDPKDKTIIYKLPTKYEGRLTANHISPSTVNFGNVVFNTGDDLGVNIFSTVPDQSWINFKTLAKFSDLEVANAKGNFQVGGVHFRKTDTNDVAVTSDASEIVFNSKARFKNLKTDEDSDVNIYKAKFNQAFFGKVRAETVGDDLHFKGEGKINVTVPTNLENATYTQLTGPSGSRATMDNLEVSSLTIGGIVISNNGQLVPGTVATPSTPGAALTFTAKLVANELEAQSGTISKLTSTAAATDSLKIGEGKFSAQEKDIVLDTTAGAKLKVKLDSEFNKLTVTDLIAPKSTVTISDTDKLTIGKVVFEKDENHLNIDRLGSDTTIKINAPVEASNFIATNFGTTNDATMKNVYATTVTVNGITWSADDDGATMTAEGKRFNFNMPVTLSNLRSTLASSLEYKLAPGDKISINADNYITNSNGKFAANLSRGFSFIGSGRDTGAKFGISEDAQPAMRYYIAGNTGTAAIDTEKNSFIEIDANDGLYLLQPTNKKISAKGSIYGFNDPTAQNNISDLRRWLRAPMFVGALEADSLRLGLVNGSNRGGVSIGETRISVIGPDTECPTGLTTFESADSIHFVTPLAKDNTCKNLTYQEVNVGPISIKGDGAAENSFTITEDLMVGGTASAGHLDVTEEASIASVKVAGTSVLKGAVEAQGSVSVGNNVNVSGAITAKGDVQGQNVNSTRDMEIGRDLRVTKDAYISGDAVVEGSLNISKGFQTAGVVKGVAFEAEDLKANSGKILTNLNVDGAATVGGKTVLGASLSVTGNTSLGSNLEVKESVVASNLYSIKDTTVREKLTVLGGTELTGAVINIGADNSKTQITGKLSINTDSLSINAPTKIFNTLKVSEDAEFSSTIFAKAGIDADAGIKAKGNISTSSSLEVGSALTAKSGEFTQDVKVGSSLIADNLTSDSIAIRERGTINNLSITGSLTMPTDTTIVVGDIKARVYSQTDSEAVSSYAGSVYVSKKLEVADNVRFNGNLQFDNGELQLSALGVKGKDAIIDVSKIKAEIYTGTNKIQPPTELAMSGNTAANMLSSVISSATNYIRLENSLFEGITVFSQPVVAGTIYYTDLVSIKERSDSGKTDSVDLTARRALYA